MGTRKGKSNEIYMADPIPSYINSSLIQRFVYKEIIAWTMQGKRTAAKGSIYCWQHKK